MKKIMSGLLVLALTLSNIVIIDAQEGNNYSRYNEEKVLKYSEELVKKNAIKAKAEQKKEEEKGVLQKEVQKRSYLPDGTVIVGEGKIWADGYIYETDQKSSSVLQNIAGVGLTIGGYAFTTVQSVVFDIATLAYELRPQDVVFSKPGMARVFISYGYQSKYGKAFSQSYGRFITHVEIEQRYVYKHEFASFSAVSVVGDSFTCTKSFDFTPANGYSHIGNDKKAYYDSNSFIENTTKYKHKQYGLPTYGQYLDGYSF